MAANQVAENLEQNPVLKMKGDYENTQQLCGRGSAHQNGGLCCQMPAGG